VAVYGLDARIVRANAPAQRLFGEMPELGLRALAERVAENQATREDGTTFALKELPVMRALRGETVTGVMMAMYSRSGSRTWQSVSAAPVRTPAAGLLGAIVSFTDVTELRQARDELEARVQERTAELVGINEVLQSEIAMRRQAEAELRESELRFRQLAENVDEMFWLIEPQ
jgi:PAS domain S-box-containing protein